MFSDTILLVEDDIDDVHLFGAAFARSGLTNPIVHIPSAQAAFEILQHAVDSAGDSVEPPILPLLILLDLKLPVMNGFEFLQAIRAIPRLSKLFVVVLTASDIEGDVLLAYELGARSYLVKPPRAAELIALVRIAGSPYPSALLRAGEIFRSRG